MPRKRKSSVSSETTRIEIKPTPDHLEVKLRRSVRRLTTDDQHQHSKVDDNGQRDMHHKEASVETKRRIQGEGVGLLGPKESSSSSSDSKEVEDKEMAAKQGVRAAIADLARMERRLVRATKRQKAKVEESSFTTVRPDKEEESAFKPEPSAWARPSRRGDICPPPIIGDQLPTPDQEAGGGEPSTIKNNAQGSTASPSAKDSGRDADEAAERPPAVNSDYLPLPWTGRLGYACLNTYLRTANPSVFSSRTCRMASIIDHRYPLQDPSMPEHPTKNFPDKTKKADRALGLKFLQGLGLANARDIVKMIRWNDKYGIKFMRLSSEMFPFASHAEHGYKLAPFAADVLADAGKVAAELGHRLTTHPGQFTQLGSPRKEVVEAAVRDLEYHDELLSLLRLPEQQNRDAVMIIHMGGVFGDKEATLGRFRENYTQLLSASIKARLVLENDDVSWSVHDLLPICEELNIPLVLDFHHHNIVFDSSQIREGTYDISQPAIMDRISATWKRKGIRQKMHYSEPCAGAVTPRDRRKHSPRVATLPPCPPDMDLMIEAKDKEQAVFELMRTFKLPGYDKINDVIPHLREDENRRSATSMKPVKKQCTGKTKRQAGAVEGEGGTTTPESVERDEEEHVSPEDHGMGGPHNRVYWPLGMEDWLKPQKGSKRNSLYVD